MDKVKFKSDNNGGFRTFMYGKFRFTIRDRRFRDRYEHALFREDVTKHEKIVFDENLEREMDEEKARFEYGDDKSFLYENETKIFRFDRRTGVLIETEQPVQISDYFSKVSDCVNFSKKYIKDFMSKNEPEQLQIISERRETNGRNG